MKMSKRAAKALEGSIEKWRGIVIGTHEDRRAENCPLCIEYAKNDCRGCPVAKAVNKSGCNGTPWPAWAHETCDRTNPKATNEVERKLALAELEFLISLRPVKE